MAHSTVLTDTENCGSSKQTWLTEIYSCIFEPGKVELLCVIRQLSSPAGSECSYINTPEKAVSSLLCFKCGWLFKDES